MARAGDEWSGPAIKRLRVLAESGSMTLHDLAVEMQRSRKVISKKLVELGLSAPDQEEGTERRCSNWNSEERPCRNTFVGKYAGPCPRCRNLPAPSRFETPAAFV